MPVGVAVAGLGEIGRLHARNLARLVPGARLVAVVDEVGGLAEEGGDELVVAWSSSFSDSLGDAGVDAVVIATPTPLHAEMVSAAARSGKHVFCEKPLALDDGSGRAAARAVQESGRRLQIGFQRRFDPDWIEARELIDAGEVGAVRLLRISHRNRAQPHGGPDGRLGSLFLDMSVHDMDSARWLVGDVEEVTAFGDDETAVIVLRFASGALGVIDNTRVAGYGFECAAEVMGSRTTLRIAPALGVERLTEQGRMLRLPSDHIERHATAYREELRHFVDCIASGTVPRVGAADALAAQSLALEAERACLRC
jgi:myo-inositol 2-dehydrogenase/D-chiro-inositol 1-dehydrogenase